MGRKAINLEGWTLILQYVRCGKPTCRRCPHGPYWYGYRHYKGRMQSRYLGKKVPFSFGGDRFTIPGRNRVDRDPLDDVFDNRRINEAICITIMKLSSLPGTAEALENWFRRQCARRHPDRGGDTTDFQRLNAAYSWLKCKY